jgi:hypothetical protein
MQVPDSWQLSQNAPVSPRLDVVPAPASCGPCTPEAGDLANPPDCELHHLSSPIQHPCSCSLSCTCMTPILLHLPCSHVIVVYRMRHVLHEGSNYMSPYYSLFAELKTWEARFEPLLDLSQ